jgi:hypothetical protein
LLHIICISIWPVEHFTDKKAFVNINHSYETVDATPDRWIVSVNQLHRCNRNLQTNKQNWRTATGLHHDSNRLRSHHGQPCTCMRISRKLCVNHKTKNVGVQIHICCWYLAPIWSVNTRIPRTRKSVLGFEYLKHKIKQKNIQKTPNALDY